LHFVWHTPLTAEECRRRLQAQTNTPLTDLTIAAPERSFVGLVHDTGFRVKRALRRQQGSSTFGSVEAIGILLPDEHGTEVRVDIGMDRRAVWLMGIVLLVVYCLATDYALVNWSDRYATRMLWLISIAVVASTSYTIWMNDPAFLEQRLRATLEVEAAAPEPG
jgi:hypothetical protein